MKTKSILAGVIAGSLFLTACADKEAEKTATAETKEKRAITVGSDLTFPPYEYLKDGVPSGVSVEIMEKMADVDGSYKPDWIDTRWANLIPGLKGDKFDILFSSMYITKERLEQIDMIPYYKTDISLLVRQDSDLSPKGPDDLCGQTVGAMKGTAFATQVVEISNERCVAQGKKKLRFVSLKHHHKRHKHF